MTHPHAEVVRRLFDAVWRERDLNAASEFVHPEADFDWSDSRAPYRGRFKGQAALSNAFQAILDAWEEFDPQFEEVIEVDRDTVLIVTQVRARGKGSGVPVEARGASVWTVRDGKVVGAKLYQSKAEALEVLGVSDAR